MKTIKKIYNWSCIPAALVRLIFLALAALICNKKIEDVGGRFFYRKTKRLIYIRCWVALVQLDY